MTVLEVVQRCIDLEVELEPDGDELVVRGHDDALVEVVPALKTHKLVLLRILSERAEDRRELFEERAAIMEYDGGLPRPKAEELARLQVARLTPTWARAWLERWEPEGASS